jgi:type I restriction enzyme M protein
MNTLSKRFQELNYYDIILANPPFKGSIDESDLSDTFTVLTKKTELLFLELMFNLLNGTGRCAVIVPDGVLFGNSSAHKNIRKLLLEECRLDAVISMPSGVFKPYADVSTGILVFNKGESTKKVWFYDMESDGFTLDDKRTRIDGKGDIPDIIEKFRKRNKEKFEDRSAKCFFVPFVEIKQKDYDLSISKYKQIHYEEVKYDKPEVLKKKILELEEQIIKKLKELD